MERKAREHLCGFCALRVQNVEIISG